MLNSIYFDRDNNCWPTPKQLLLIKAGLLPEQTALQSWEQWCASVDIQKLEGASERLLPLVYHNLKYLSLDSSDFITCKSTYRHVWLTNKIMFHEFFKVVTLFSENNISFVLLKGAAQCLKYYRDVGARVIGDIDILLQRNQALLAIQVLLAAGWRMKDLSTTKFTDGFFETRHAIGFVNDKKLQIDVHWHLLPETCGTSIDTHFIERSSSLEIEGHVLRFLDPADQLLHTLVHGLKYSPEPLVRWIPDAVTIINTSPGLDWAYLIQISAKIRVSYAVSLGLHFLQENFQIQIPEEILQKLASLSRRSQEIIVFKKINSRSAMTPLQSLWLMHTRRTDFANILYRLMTFPTFLTSFWQLNSIFLMPFYAFYKYIRYYWRKLRFKRSKSYLVVQD